MEVKGDMNLVSLHLHKKMYFLAYSTELYPSSPRWISILTGLGVSSTTFLPILRI
jgi:hypothetical protein